MAASASTSTSANLNNNNYDVVINFRGPDVQKTLASHLYRRLLSHRLKPFFAVTFLQQLGDHLYSQITAAIRTASVNVAIFSPNYAESSWCLSELVLMLESRAPIIPVFFHVKPSHLRWARLGKGRYAKDLRNHEADNKNDSHTIENWGTALSTVAELLGYELEDCNGDEGELVDKVVEFALEKCKRPPLKVFINHRGPDVKKTFASHLYHRLHSCGMQVFLDQEELQGGDNFPSRIKDAITNASVHVAIFSPGYAESNWCLDELLLMLESKALIIPVFYHVKPANIRWTRVNKKRGRTGVKNGVYSQALHKLEMKKRYDSATIEKWRNALCSVAEISGIDLEAFFGDEGALLNKVVERVLNCKSNELKTE